MGSQSDVSQYFHQQIAKFRGKGTPFILAGFILVTLIPFTIKTIYCYNLF